ncbi:Uncharacterised protein [Streptococcus constellatus]|uniref:Permease of the major facilitator superfamily n=1 Tax=Streptococcus constellatus TaxID=76860 RepID=A0A564U1E8_STRCV|nr:hypothetical protein [Streptococcus constellatus]VUW98915.1 Uncharacterised protein [Streptococcus gordonii]VUX13336.1 Uncharacterised protein [Streptococcus constellatus]
MNWTNIARAVLIGIASSAYVTIHYDDKKYKPFGFRYWLSLFSLIVVGVAHLFLAAITLGILWLMITKFSLFLLGIWFFLVFLVIGNTILLVGFIKVLIARTKCYKKLNEDIF